jgi:hypothetical protein
LSSLVLSDYPSQPAFPFLVTNTRNSPPRKKEVIMARLMSIAATVALVLSAAFAAGLTCGG